MRILVLGAGGIGGYFGARMHVAGGDVTFLVRPARAAQLRDQGLRVSSPLGNAQISPRILTGDQLIDPFDVIFLSCKAYDLDSAITAIAPGFGEQSVILPLLNGVAHIERLSARFGPSRVLGGVALISVMLAPDGEIRHLNRLQRIIAGPLTSPSSPWLPRLAQLLAASGVDFSLSDHVEQAMWDKLVFLSALAGATCTLRAGVGDILRTVGGEAFVTGLLADCAGAAAVNGHAVAEKQLAAFGQQLSDRSSTLMASMLRDIERGGPTEADHILGYLHDRARAAGLDTPLLRLAYSHLQAYEIRRRAAS
ncbi:ketopantoate reductase family protein [Accumulibacter sp.]|uniref:ketopantoate reductase family protein n=1 Tax=Accumulibacter sp. TaxID=2053492 RepID=UPI00261BE457|nr:ketopantoate reductase family protein [Accumulibacter sp.]